jgi:cytochrome bd-type quinol oxidase subunit 2
VRVVKALLRFFSYLYHLLFALVMMVFGGLVAIAHGDHSVRLDMLPWTDHTLIHVLLFGGLGGLIITILAIRGKLRPLFFLWALVVTYYLIKGYFLGGYRFTPDEFKNVVYLVIAALIALLGAFVQMFRKAR